MIRVNRGDEPEVMRRARRRCLAAAMIAKQDGHEVSFDDYDVARDELLRRLNYKCAFCEFDLRDEGNPVEHFRPKGGVRDVRGKPIDPHRYWWLAWTWENLLFACDRCNTHHKKNQFPLEPGTSPIAECCFDLDTERPLLIDPAKANDDPREHISFKWSESRRKWLPVPKSGSERGRVTIEILKLDEDDKAAAHLEARVTPVIEEIRDAIPDGDNVRRKWKRWMTSLFRPGQPFHALTWDALEAEFSKEFRAKYQVELPSLGHPGPTPVATPVHFHSNDDPAEFQWLSERLKLEIRAIGDRTPEDVAIALLKKVEAARQWTDEELARLFARALSTIQRWKKAAR